MPGRDIVGYQGHVADTSLSPLGRYPNAIVDSRQSLKFKKELYPPESEIVAEAHFKLSLALEFASITSSGDDEENDSSKAAGPKPVDEGLREEAATELEAAIESTKLKLQKKEVDLVVMHSPEDNELTRKQIAEVKDVIADMEQRVCRPSRSQPSSSPLRRNSLLQPTLPRNYLLTTTPFSSSTCASLPSTSTPRSTAPPASPRAATR